MNNEERDKLIKKYAELNKNLNEKDDTPFLPFKEDTSFPSLFPIAMQVAAQTVGMDLVSVVPMPSIGGNTDELERIENEVKTENRDRKIKSILENGNYVEMRPEDHPDWKKNNFPSGQLFYLDFKYDSDDESKQINNF